MKTSNLFSDYMIGSSVNRSNRSINNSPTTGTVHKQRSSFGPKLTLMNKSRDQNNLKDDQTASGSSQYIEKILLLSIEISRLNSMNQTMRKSQIGSAAGYSSNIEGSKQAYFLKQTNDSLKVAIKTLQQSLTACQQQKNKISSKLKAEISDLQIENRSLKWKLADFEKQLKQYTDQNQSLKLSLEREKIERSKTQMHHSRVNKQIQNSIISDKQRQILNLKDNLRSYETRMNDQKYMVNNLKQNIEMLNNREAQLLLQNQHYQTQFQIIRKKVNYELKDASTNTLSSTLVEQDLKKKLNSVYIQMTALQQELDARQSKIQELTQNNYNLRNANSQLQSKYHDNQFMMHSKNVNMKEQYKFEISKKQSELNDLRQQVERLTLEIDLLKKVINQQRDSLSLRKGQENSKIQDLNKKIRQKQKTIRNYQRTQRSSKLTDPNRENMFMSPDTKLFKSRSIDSTSFLTSRKNITQLNLDSIVTEVTGLQNSNERSLRLINKSKSKLRFSKRSSDEYQETGSSVYKERKALTSKQNRQNQKINIIDSQATQQYFNQ